MDYRFRLKDEQTGHKHQKSIDFLTKIFNKYSRTGSLIVDIFGGSGSTMVACEQLDRTCYMIELEPKYCQVIINRMRKAFPSLEVKINGVRYD
jgi:DNA modification methylase